MAGGNAVKSVKLPNLKVIVENKRGYNCGSAKFRDFGYRLYTGCGYFSLYQKFKKLNGSIIHYVGNARWCAVYTCI